MIKIFFHSEPLMLKFISKAQRMSLQTLTDTATLTDFDTLIEAVRREDRALVISGQYSPEVTTDIIATEVKRANPRAVFLVFSSNPQVNQYVDGIIPRNIDWHVILALMSVDLDAIGREELKEAFPMIAWLT